MELELIVTFAGIVLAGVAGVLGVWMERDREAPQRWAWVFSSLILVAVGIEMVHSVAAEAADSDTEDRMASVLEQLAMLSTTSDNPALKSFVNAELATQARSNPGVLDKVGERIAAKGGDPAQLRRAAAVGRRTAAGLPARRPPGATRPGSRSAGAGKAGKAGSKAGKSGGNKGGKGKSSGKKSGGGKGKSSSGKKGGKGKSSGGKKSGGSKGKSSGKKGGKGKSSGKKSGGGKKGGKKKR